MKIDINDWIIISLNTINYTLLKYKIICIHVKYILKKNDLYKNRYKYLQISTLSFSQ